MRLLAIVSIIAFICLLSLAMVGCAYHPYNDTCEKFELLNC
jgi:hypothetical protein